MTDTEIEMLRRDAVESGLRAHLRHYRGIVMALKEGEEQWSDPVRTPDGVWSTSTTAYNPAGDGDRTVFFVEDEDFFWAHEHQVDELGQDQFVNLASPPARGIARILVWIATLKRLEVPDA